MRLIDPGKDRPRACKNRRHARLCEADAGTRTPDPFITSEERRFRLFAAGSLFACSGADLASLLRTAFAAVSGCSIAHSLPTSTSTGKLGFAPAAGSLWLQVLAPARHRPRGCATRVRAHPASSRTLPCVWRRCAAGPRRASRSSRPLAAPSVRSGAAELATSARADTWPETGQARSGVDRPARGDCATLPEANRALGPAHARVPRRRRAETRGRGRRAAEPRQHRGERRQLESGKRRFPPRKSSGGFPPSVATGSGAYCRGRASVTACAMDRARAVGAAHESDWYDC